MKCTKCETDKPLSDFYAKDRRCKECRCAIVRANRLENLEKYREYDKARSMRPDRVEARKAYRETDAGKAAVARAHAAYQSRAPERRAAHIAVGNAVRDRRLTPWAVCSLPDCECTEVEAHHPDYSRPLDVVWLCDKHHKATHAIVRGQST